MQQIYNLTREIHSLIPKINQKYGLKIEVDGDYTINQCETTTYAQIFATIEARQPEKLKLKDMGSILVENGYIPAIQAQQIRQILIGLQEFLGENPEYTEYTNLKEKYKQELNTNGFFALRNTIWLTPETLAEALYQRWLCGFPKSKFEVNEIEVLTELLQVLKAV